jgi:glyoxylase-like metal-dependent hydrolase (beta-lactamase superfamily II)
VLKQMVKVIHNGDANGKNMIIKLTLSSGLDIYGFATPNFYGGDWDYGASWNYLVLSDQPFLLDTGRFNMGKKLLDMINAASLSINDFKYIVISHGHEDHDGGLYDLVHITGKRIKAHVPYKRLTHFYPDLTPADAKADFPASCWHCFMPEAYVNRNCLKYHKERILLDIEDIKNGNSGLGEKVKTYHVPGHSPDSLAIQLGEEAILVGDTILPEITPFPSCEAFFYQVEKVLYPEYTTADELYGLRAYIRSIKKLKNIGEKYSNIITLPGHRLFSNDNWNEINLRDRVDELIEHHIQRCAAVLNIIKKEAKTIHQIAEEHFPSHMLKDIGSVMACLEIHSHLELLIIAEDVMQAGMDKFIADGSSNFENIIRNLS